MLILIYNVDFTLRLTPVLTMTVTPQSPAIVAQWTDAGVEATVSPTGAGGGEVATVLTVSAHFITALWLLHQVDTSSQVLVQSSPGQCLELLK